MIVSFVDRLSQAAVTGDVNAANKFTVNLGGDRVLDMIAKANGLRFEGWETYVNPCSATEKSRRFIFFDL